jgi:predicted nucleic acid-binding protein
VKVLIDTNIIIDVIEKREGFFDKSYAIMELAATDENFEIVAPAGSIADVYYIIKKSGKSASEAKNAITTLLQLVSICDTAAKDISAALLLPISDFEDAIVVATAKREKAEYIITRDEGDFIGSPIPAISPTEFLKINKQK